MSWQPIETAPKDEGLEIIGWDGAQWDKTWIAWFNGYEPVWVRADWVSWTPTHWMPAPELPPCT